MPQRHMRPSADLHNHLGASVRPSILWSIAHRQGIKLPTKSYWEVEDMITMTGRERNRSLQEMHDRFFRWTELIQSSPEAIEESVKAVIDGGYRRSNIVLHELRFNPMKRNRGGERDLDHTIISALWGMDKALLEYPQVKAGIILMMDRTFPKGLNEIIVEKAVRYRERGIVGVDLAGPNKKGFSMAAHRELFLRARRAGLGVTIHTGEEHQLQEMRYVVDKIRPDRIGHGVQCAEDRELMKAVARRGIVLEVCPTSNLRNSVIADVDRMRETFGRLLEHDVRFAICTDGPEMYQTHLYQEEAFLLENGILAPRDIDRARKTAFSASFIA
jgi:adenosine deaminase